MLDIVLRNISKRLAFYLLGRFFRLFLVITLGVCGILLAFDMLAHADTVLAFHSDIIRPLLSYAVLRAAPILVLVVPIAALLATMLLFAQMVMRQEIAAARSLGVSVYRVCIILLGGGALIAACLFLFADLVLPNSAGTLRAWAQNDYRGAAFEAQTLAQETMHWHAAADADADDELGARLLHIDEASADGRILSGVRVISRDADGLITRIDHIERAVFEDGAWSERGIDVPPGFFAQVQKDAAEWRYGALAGLVESGAGGAAHETWLQGKIVQPLSVLIMILMAAPMAFQMARRGDMLAVGFGIILAGFSYFIAERLMVSLGESEALPAVLAVWSPFVLAGLAASWLLLVLEG